LSRASLHSGLMEQGPSNDYFERRAEEERIAAEKTTDERAAQSHRQLSEYYRAMASGSTGAATDAPELSDDGILSKDFQILP